MPWNENDIFAVCEDLFQTLSIFIQADEIDSFTRDS